MKEVHGRFVWNNQSLAISNDKILSHKFTIEAHITRINFSHGNNRNKFIHDAFHYLDRQTVSQTDSLSNASWKSIQYAVK